MRVSVIIPALNEEASIGTVVAAVPRDAADEILVVDNNSTDNTARAAEAAGARVVIQSLRGYGAACLAGAQAASGDVLVFMDGDGSFDPRQIPSLLEPIRGNHADLVLGSRALGSGTQGAMLAHQRLGNALAVALLRALYGLRVTDLGPFRAIRREKLLHLDMSEMTYGWPIEMMIKAARHNDRVLEVSVSYASRLAGQSKVSGTLKGSLLAGYRIMSTILRSALADCRRPGKWME